MAGQVWSGTGGGFGLEGLAYFELESVAEFDWNMHPPIDLVS
jgi:hypothetical protein